MPPRRFPGWIRAVPPRRVLVHAYMRDAVKHVTLVRGLSLGLALIIAAALTLQAGIFPSRYIKATEQAARELSAAAAVVEPAAAVAVKR